MQVKMTVNGRPVSDEVEPRLLLVHYLRERLRLTGTHVGCETTNCGACTVLVGRDAVKSCTMFTVQADKREIMTIEGLASDAGLHPVQEGFWARHGLQCGYCTPGMVLSGVALLHQDDRPSEEEIWRAIEGNLCRCTGYRNIVQAIEYAAARLRGEKPPPADWEDQPGARDAAVDRVGGF